METVARRMIVTGRVQGVFFRAWTRDEAQTIGLAGWVRNRADGSVEAHAEGDQVAVDEFIELLAEGPPDAEVDDVAVDTVDVEGVTGFEIRH